MARTFFIPKSRYFLGEMQQVVEKNLIFAAVIDKILTEK
jgi:hypothetical protein